MTQDRVHALEFDGIYQRFGAELLALDDLNLTVDRGELVTVVGPSGCGKSTLLRIAAGLIAPTAGSARVHGKPVTGPRLDVAFMFQRPTLLPWANAIENVLLPISLRRRVGAAHRVEAERLLALVGLENFEDRYPQHLSGGMQQRVALARLLMTGAEVLLLDEPFGSVDEFTREKLNLELLRIHQQAQATIVLVTHNIQEAVLLGRRVVAMTPRPGRIARIVDVDLGGERGQATLRDPRLPEFVNTVRDAFANHLDAA